MPVNLVDLRALSSAMTIINMMETATSFHIGRLVSLVRAYSTHTWVQCRACHVFCVQHSSVGPCRVVDLLHGRPRTGPVMDIVRSGVPGFGLSESHF
jgi:hypothetical protein